MNDKLTDREKLLAKFPSKPHISPVYKSIFELNTDKPIIETCPCNSCLDLHRRIMGKDSPLEWRYDNDEPGEIKEQVLNETFDNGWKCPECQHPPSKELEKLIKRAKWKLGDWYYSQDGVTPDLDPEGLYYASGSIATYMARNK